MSFLLLLIIALGINLELTGRAIENPNPNQTIFLTTQTPTLNINDTLIVEIYLKNSKDIHGYDLGFNYDKTTLQVKNITETNYLGNTKNTDYLCVDYDLTQPGEIKNVACSKVGHENAPEGTHKIEVLTFKATNPGESIIDLSKREVANWSGISNNNSEPTIYNWQATT